MKTSKWSRFWFSVSNALLKLFTGQTVEQRVEKVSKASARQMLAAFSDGLQMIGEPLTLGMLAAKLSVLATEKQGFASEKCELAGTRRNDADRVYAEAMRIANETRSTAHAQADAVQREADVAQQFAAKANALAQTIGQ